jgi:serine/threonine-protein kinase
MSFEIGEITGDYEIVGVLGSGGMGKVYKVRNILSDRFDAMKVLLPDLTTNPELGDRFLREIKVQARLNHPNIASLHTALRINNQLLMIMELVEGDTLEEEIHYGPIGHQDAEKYLIQVLSALEYAHKNGVVHRDIKPANIILTPSGQVKLMDFGIARVADDRSLTKTGIALGSLFYMSPEQVNGQTPDARSDIYALGVTFYEVLTGKKPIDGDSDYSIMTGHLQRVPLNPAELNPELPGSLADVILKSLEKAPENRFQTAEEFLAAVIEAKRNPRSGYQPNAQTVVTRPVPVLRPVTPTSSVVIAEGKKTRPAIWVALAATVLLAGLGVSRFAGNGSSSSPLPAAAPSSVLVARPDPEKPAAAAQPTQSLVAIIDKSKPVQHAPAKAVENASTAVPPPSPLPQQAAPVPAVNFPIVVRQPATPGPPVQTIAAAPAVKDPRLIAQDDWDRVSGSNSIPALQDFQRKYPDSPFSAQAAARIERLTWESVTGTKDGKALRAFRAQFPNGPHAAQASAEIDALDAEANSHALLDTLNRYQAAYESRDTDAIRTLWPSLGRDDLSKIDGFFKATRSAKMTLQPQGSPKFSGDTATIACRRSITAQMKDGTRQRPAEQDVTVRLKKSGAAWVISALD